MRSILSGVFLLESPTTGYFYRPGALDAIDVAARKLGIEAPALRTRCECIAERRGDVAVAHLPGGVVGIATGDVWRFRFPVGHALRSARAAWGTLQ